MYISQPYLDFKDGSSEVVFSLSRTIDLSTSNPNSMLFFIVEVRASQLQGLFDLRPTFEDFEVVISSSQGYIYSAPDYWQIDSSNLINNRIYDIKELSGLDQAAFVQVQNSNFSFLSKLNAAGVQSSFAVTNSLILEDYKGSYSSLETVVLGGD